MVGWWWWGGGGGVVTTGVVCGPQECIPGGYSFQKRASERLSSKAFRGQIRVTKKESRPNTAFDNSLILPVKPKEAPGRESRAALGFNGSITYPIL